MIQDLGIYDLLDIEADHIDREVEEILGELEEIYKERVWDEAKNN